MANQIGGFNPIVIDTASATPVMKDRVYITHIAWVSENAAQNDECLIVDARTGAEIFHSYAAGADWVDARSFNREYAVYGFTVSTLTSGKVDISYR